jgi:TusE/DsrC/DsvC family sulfur relay protein
MEEDRVMNLRGGKGAINPDFPNAPEGWTQEEAVSKAAEDGLSAGSGHWDLVRALQEFYSRHDEARINSRELHDALEERFHSNGGMKYLYELFPGGPVTQGCHLAGLEPPGGGADTGFGSVQ